MADLSISHMRSCNKRIEDDSSAHKRSPVVPRWFFAADARLPVHSDFATPNCSEWDIRVRANRVGSLA
jgi:hypothetical protein